MIVFLKALIIAVVAIVFAKVLLPFLLATLTPAIGVILSYIVSTLVWAVINWFSHLLSENLFNFPIFKV